MKFFLIGLIVIVAISCNHQKQDQNIENTKTILQNNDPIPIKLILPGSLEDRRQKFQCYVYNARSNIRDFLEKYGWGMKKLWGLFGFMKDLRCT